MQEKDGPSPPDKFYYGGNPHSGLTGKPFLMVSALWQAKDRTVFYEALADKVWGDKAMLLSNDQVASCRRQANRFFEKATLPFRVRVYTSDYAADTGARRYCAELIEVDDSVASQKHH